MTKAFDSAVRLLTRREHSALELYNKLKQKGYSSIEIKEALDTCQRMNLQNDGRFVEVYSHLRIRQGYGPLKISQELSSKGIDKGLIHQFLQQEQDNWLHYALNVWQKKVKDNSIFLLTKCKSSCVFCFIVDLVWMWLLR